MNKGVCRVRGSRLLITMPWGIGDAISIGLCAVDQVTRNDPGGDIAIHILCNRLQAPLFEYDPRVRAVIIVDDSLFPTAAEGTWKRGLFLLPEARQLAKHLRHQHYAAVLPLFFGPTFFYMLHTPVLFLNVQEVWNALAMARTFQEISLQQIVRRVVNKGFGESAPTAGVDEPIPLYLCPEHLRKARQYMAWRNRQADLPQNYHPWLLVAPDTSSVITRPPTALLAQGIAGALRCNSSLIVEILPGYTDRQAAHRLWHALAPQFPGRIFLMPAEPRLSLLDLAAFIDQSDIFLSGDTGTMHLAAAVKMLPRMTRADIAPRNTLKVIALFGGTHPSWHGYSRHTTIIGQGRKEQIAFTPGIVKEMYRPDGRNFFDHISPCQITRAILQKDI